MFPDQIRKIIQFLSEATVAKSVKWMETPDDDVFRALLHSGMVRLERFRDPNARYDSDEILANVPFGIPNNAKGVEGYTYCIVVLDEKNREITRYFPVDEPQAFDLRNLWESARNSALNSERTLQRILEELARKTQKQPT